MFSSRFMLFPTLKKKNDLKKKFGGGGVWNFCNVFLTFYAISNISRQTIWEYKPIISYLMFSSCFFCMLQNIKVPRHLQLLVKWEVVSPNSRYRAFYHEIGNIEKCPFTYWLNGGGGLFLQIVDGVSWNLYIKKKIENFFFKI